MPARLDVQDLIINKNIDVQDLFDTYMNNGKNFTAAKFELSNWHLVERILKECGYDISSRDSKKINVEKTTNSLIEKYGVKHALQIPKSKEKLKKTNQERFGSDYFMGTKLFKEKSKETNLDRYGFEWSTQNPEVKQRHIQANLDKYGVIDAKQANSSDKLKVYLNDKEKSIELLQSADFTYVSILDEFPDDAPSKVYSWLTRFDLYSYLKKTSKSDPELKLYEEIKKFGFTQRGNRSLLDNHKEIDIYNPDLKIGIEFNGIYYHSDAILKDKNYHLNKSKKAEELGIRLIHIYENEWYDLHMREKILSLIKIASGNVDKKIYARNCEIQEISNKEAKSFNEANHLQGHRNAQVTYGLFYKGKLVQLMSFSKTKWNRNLKGDNDWEIIRGCPGSNNIVVGGVSKLFKHFIREYDPDSVFSYCDFNKFDGKGYEAIGMKFIGYTGPNKWWVVGYKLVNRNPRRYKELKAKASTCLWGAGSKKYVWTKGS